MPTAPRDWPGPYLCTVYADSTKWRNAHKLWIPEKSEFDKKTLWYQQANIDQYIQHYKLVPASTIRFSPITGKPGAMQMVIPPALLGSSPLGLTVHCEVTPTDPKKFPGGLNYPNLSRDWAIGGVKPE
ncbi:hypothetical protein V500_02202 [Pseudogymnoascus sp. VKM F-4518 (FW-2643)]|nr:hypothetical protein V500_02202 [Pseudogymnoascus sp. VKM F-4518 (FW-2643)]